MDFLTLLGGTVFLTLLIIFWIVMAIACAFDRNQMEEPKWFVFIIGGMVLCAGSYFTGDSANLVAYLKENLPKFIGYYLLIGLAYSALEFGLDIRRSKRYWSKKWEDFMAGRRPKIVKDKAKLRSDGEPNERDVQNDLIHEFMSSSSVPYSTRRIIYISKVVDEDGKYTGIEPKINRSELAQSIGCWTIWWPFYALSLVFGDLLVEFFRTVADILASFSGRFVKLIFRNTFRI